MKRTLFVLLLAFLAVVSSLAVMAKDSTVAVGEYTLTVRYDPNKGSVSVTHNPDGTITVIGTTHDGGVFTGWELTDGYEIVSGSLSSGSFTIRLKKDVIATMTIADSEYPAGPTEDSPKTGSTILVFPVLFVLGMAACTTILKTKRNEI